MVLPIHAMTEEQSDLLLCCSFNVTAVGVCHKVLAPCHMQAPVPIATTPTAIVGQPTLLSIQMEEVLDVARKVALQVSFAVLGTWFAG